MGQQQCVEQVVGDDDRRSVGQHLPQHPAQQSARPRRPGRPAARRAAADGVRRPAPGRSRPAGPVPRTAAPACGSANSCAPTSVSQRSAVRPRLGRALPARAGPEGDVVPYGQVREQQRILGEHGDAARPGRRPVAAAPVRRRRRTGPGRRARPVRRRGAGCRRGSASTVDLPAPFGPSSATRSPSVRARRSTSTWRAARVARMVRVIGGNGSARLGVAGPALAVRADHEDRRPRPAPATARRRRRRRSRAAGRSPAATYGSRPAGCRRR